MNTLTIGEPPPFELQICRTSGDYRYLCKCRHCERAYRRRLSQLIAESEQAVALLTVLEEEAPAVITHSLTCPQTRLSRGICECDSCMATKQRILAAVQATDAHLLHTMQAHRPGKVPGLPQSLDGALAMASGQLPPGTMAEVGRVKGGRL